MNRLDYGKLVDGNFEYPPVEVPGPMRIEKYPSVLLFTVSLYPALSPMNIELLALTAPYPAPFPKKFELIALVAPYPALGPKKFERLALVAPYPAPFPKKFEL